MENLETSGLVEKIQKYLDDSVSSEWERIAESTLFQQISEIGKIRIRDDATTFTRRVLVEKSGYEDNLWQTALFSAELVYVQPLPAPSGLIFFMDYKYEDGRRNVYVEKSPKWERDRKSV